MSKETGEPGGNKVYYLPTCGRVALLCSVEQEVETGEAYPYAAAPAGKEDTMSIEQLDTRQPQRQPATPVKL